MIKATETEKKIAFQVYLLPEVAWWEFNLLPASFSWSLRQANSPEAMFVCLFFPPHSPQVDPLTTKNPPKTAKTRLLSQLYVNNSSPFSVSLHKSRFRHRSCSFRVHFHLYRRYRVRAQVRSNTSLGRQSL